MKTKILSLLTVLALSLVFGSCEKELDIEQLGNLGGEDTFYITDDDAVDAITCCYYDLYSNFTSIMMTANMLSDDVWCGGASKGDNADLENLSAYVFGSDNGYVKSIFTGLYTMIYDANLVLEKFDDFDTDTKKQAQAEAYFFRGLAHFYLGAFFGTAPVVNHLLEPSEYSQGNSTKEELFNQAISDFNSSLSVGNLSSKSSSDEAIVRVTEEAVKSYLGKAYVFMEDWSSAATTLNEVVNSGKYELYSGNFENVLRTVSDFNSESVLEVNQVNDPANIDWTFTSFVNIYNIFHGWRSNQHDWSGKLTEYSDLATDGYGFCNPRESIYNAFVEVEGTDGYRLNQSIKTSAQVNAMGIKIKDGSKLHGSEGFYNWKNRYLSSEKILSFGYDVFTDNNLRYMRYAEVLLLAAEANLENGNDGMAVQCYNLVRTRAQLATKSSVTLDDIKVEKRLELFEEGCRWMDLVRWGDASSVLGEQGKDVMCFDGSSVTVEYSNSSSKGFVNGKHEVLPIPEEEILLNANIEQNPNW